MTRFLLVFFMAIFSAGMLAQEEKEVVTGAGYANDAYYSLDNGALDTVPRNNWDVGFTTNSWSSSILANHASGVELYTYSNGDIDDWADLDTLDMIWSPMYNSNETWEEGAFSAHALGHPDYGWGIYNTATHDLSGDSLFVIKTVAGVYKKLAIVKRGSMANTWEFKYANLDGTDEQSMTLNGGDYNTKSYVYYSLDTQTALDREPATEDWDMVFTKYHLNSIDYFVTGVLTNEAHMEAVMVREPGLDQATHTEFEIDSMSSNISAIGSDWKRYDFAIGWVLDDTTVYFLKKTVTVDDVDMVSLYKIYFTGFTGSTANGKYIFMQEEISTVSVEDNKTPVFLEAYPNPASDQLNLVFDFANETRLQIIDITGKTVYSQVYQGSGFSALAIDVSHLSQGFYFLKAEGDGINEVIRFIKD
jgi:hypothetical protein